jgi:hypothetical protein
MEICMFFLWLLTDISLIESNYLQLFHSLDYFSCLFNTNLPSLAGTTLFSFVRNKQFYI